MSHIASGDVDSAAIYIDVSWLFAEVKAKEFYAKNSIAEKHFLIFLKVVYFPNYHSSASIRLFLVFMKQRR